MEEKEMTKQEAIDTLKLYSNNRFGIVSEPFWKALSIALDALKSQDTGEPDWSKAPDGFNWYGIDDDGRRFWYQNEPTKTNTEFLVKDDGLYLQDRGEKYMKLFKRP